MPHLNLKRNLSKIWPAKTHDRKLILLYHSVGHQGWAMSAQQFSEQMNWLADHCSVLSLTNLIQAEPGRDIQVALTFDDGYQSLYEQALPILIEKKLTATVYLNTGWMGQKEDERQVSRANLGHYPDETFLLWSEVEALYQAGWEIGSHGVNHYNFAEVQASVARQELAASKQAIEQRLKTSCVHFSYPWGRYSPNLQGIVKSCGYEYAVAARHAQLTERANLLALPRMNIAREYSYADFKNIIYGQWDFLGLVQKWRGL
jgi:peptidoglycan/xylan/chitin deacetylase (PgdA/CDA1 family)